ncbi:MAG: site-specific DNA-methyltransferase [Leptospiraceae bacterium]|nr:site-specific DNA-methyltransferase [Leptospiraceae bacterium]MCK6382253.1 site-specific DNA-methyltransferase [Leptospiraceae bacterium]NUM40678.1 site-specific DNA-methyltransferase [Leptospiraceae bacterium]
MNRNNLSLKDNKTEVGEFWTSMQRQSHPIHYVVSYRASFKPELPSFFMNKYLNKKKSIVLDPFGGRGTTCIQANLEGHFGIHNDINPVSNFLAESRKNIPSISDLEKTLNKLNLKTKTTEESNDEDMLHFFHKDTLNEIKNLKKIFIKDNSPEIKYIILTALSRLHGHSPGFFSVYTFPQISIEPKSQEKNNIKRNQKPEYREVKPRIYSKMKRDLSKPLPPFYHEFSANNLYLNQSATNISLLKDSSVDLIITSPPFLDKVDYAKDNWMRKWFLGLQEEPRISIFKNLSEWNKFISDVFKESSRVLKKNSYIVMEVGEVQKGNNQISLEKEIIQNAKDTSLYWKKTYINSQKFTKLSNCWKVDNNLKGTNSNRCVVFQNIK